MTSINTGGCYTKKFLMKIKILTLLFFLSFTFCQAQVSLKEISLEKGRHQVGFKHYLVWDSTRTYSRIFDWNSKSIPRPIPLSVWYPSNENLIDTPPNTILNYMEILKEEEEWEYLPNEQILNWFYYANTTDNVRHLIERTEAYMNAKPESGKFPAIIYAPSYQASSIENFALCEFLASHGYVIMSSPSRGSENRFLEGGTDKDIDTQARDIEFLIKELSGYPNVDKNKIATMGFSFGGLSNVLAQMRNGNIKAIVSLDGSIKYQYSTIEKSPYFSVEKVGVPFIHMAQKDIPIEVMNQDKIDSTLNYSFTFYDELTNSWAFSLKFHHLTHSYFSTLGLLFQERDTRQDKSDLEIMESYRLMSIYTLNFLNAFLKMDMASLNFLERRPEENNISADLVSISSKLPDEMPFSFEDFNDLAYLQNYDNLILLYDSIQAEHITFKLEESKLNNLGLQLVFNPETSKQGIKIFILAIKIYSESANLYDSLGEAYLFIGNKELAINNFMKSLKLNPQNINAISRLEELKDTE